MDTWDQVVAKATSHLENIFQNMSKQSDPGANFMELKMSVFLKYYYTN